MTPAATDADRLWPDEFYELHARAEDRHWWFIARRRILRALAARILPASRATIVDVGCGTGANIASFGGTRERYGFDPSPRAVDLAKRRFPGVRFEVGRAEDAPPGLLGRADLVLLMDVLEHIDDDAGVLRPLLDGARAGCHVLITVPAEPRLWSAHDVALGHRRRYTVETLRALWRGAPVGVRLLSPFNARLYWPIRAWRRLRAGRGPRTWPADLRLPPAPVNRLLLGVFAGEARPLSRAIDAPPPYQRGVSLIALLRRA